MRQHNGCRAASSSSKELLGNRPSETHAAALSGDYCQEDYRACPERRERCDSDVLRFHLGTSPFEQREIIMAAGKVSTQASAMFRIVDICSPEPFAAMVPAMADESTCVVETGSPYPSAAAIVAAAVISAQAPWA